MKYKHYIVIRTKNPEKSMFFLKTFLGTASKVPTSYLYNKKHKFLNELVNFFYRSEIYSSHHWVFIVHMIFQSTFSLYSRKLSLASKKDSICSSELSDSRKKPHQPLKTNIFRSMTQFFQLSTLLKMKLLFPRHKQEFV
jgi:hypothetical protein